MMSVFCYMRLANKDELPMDKQSESVRSSAEEQGFKVVNTGSCMLDNKLLSLLTTQQGQLNEAVITFRVQKDVKTDLVNAILQYEMLAKLASMV